MGNLPVGLGLSDRMGPYRAGRVGGNGKSAPATPNSYFVRLPAEKEPQTQLVMLLKQARIAVSASA